MLCYQIPGVIFLIPVVRHVVHAVLVHLINGFGFHVCVVTDFIVPCYIFHVYFVVGVAEVEAIQLFKSAVVLVPFQNFLGGYTPFFIMCVVCLLYTSDAADEL